MGFLVAPRHATINIHPAASSRVARSLTGLAKSANEAKLERFPIMWNHVIDKDSLKFKELEHVLIEKVEQLFRDML
jgi:hypothetical protein